MTNSAFKSLLTFLCSSIQLIHCSPSALSPAAHPASLPLAETVGPRSDWSTGEGVLCVVRGGWERERWRESCHQVGVMELCVVTRQLSPTLYPVKPSHLTTQSFSVTTCISRANLDLRKEDQISSLEEDSALPSILRFSIIL